MTLAEQIVNVGLSMIVGVPIVALMLSTIVVFEYLEQRRKK